MPPTAQGAQIPEEKPSKPPRPSPPTALERRQIAHFRKLREKFHAGPSYTRSGGVTKRSPFEMPTYTIKYKRANQAVPRLGSYYVKEFFPQELWSALENEGKHPPDKLHGRELGRHRPKGVVRGQTSASRKQQIEAAAQDAADELDDDIPEPEPADDDFGENESDAGDYNAEAYFEDGGDDYDMGDDGDGGGEEAY